MTVPFTRSAVDRRHPSLLFGLVRPLLAVRRVLGAGAAVAVAALLTLAFITPASASASDPVAQPNVAKETQAQAAADFRAAGVTWSSSGGCTTRSNSTCTSFEQINVSTVQGVITLKRASGCAINITGGTEVGHASGTYSHYNGYKVDIAHNACIDGYIHNNFTRIGNRADGYPQWEAASGNIYCDEGSHWDITYYTCGC